MDKRKNTQVSRMKKRNPVKKNMDKFHKPRTHKDKTKYDRRTESEKMQDELEPIWHPTEHDESDDLEDAKVIDDEYRKLNEFMARGI